MNWLKRIYWRIRWQRAYPLMQQAKQEYEALIEANKLADATRAYKAYIQYRRAASHYAMKLVRK